LKLAEPTSAHRSGLTSAMLRAKAQQLRAKPPASVFFQREKTPTTINKPGSDKAQPGQRSN